MRNKRLLENEKSGVLNMTIKKPAKKSYELIEDSLGDVIVKEQNKAKSKKLKNQ